MARVESPFRRTREPPEGIAVGVSASNLILVGRGIPLARFGLGAPCAFILRVAAGA
jgi:hypothetical protein